MLLSKADDESRRLKSAKGHKNRERKLELHLIIYDNSLCTFALLWCNSSLSTADSPSVVITSPSRTTLTVKKK
jgi:hypothetical protein